MVVNMGPKQSPTIPVHTLVAKHCCRAAGLVPRRFWWAHTCKMCVLKTFSSGNLFIGEKTFVRKLASMAVFCMNHWHNITHLGWSSATSRCTLCTWNGYKPSSCNTHHTVACKISNYWAMSHVLASGCSLISCKTASSTTSVRADWHLPWLTLLAANNPV